MSGATISEDKGEFKIYFVELFSFFLFNAYIAMGLAQSMVLAAY